MLTGTRDSRETSNHIWTNTLSVMGNGTSLYLNMLWTARVTSGSQQPNNPLQVLGLSSPVGRTSEYSSACVTYTLVVPSYPQGHETAGFPLQSSDNDKNLAEYRYPEVLSLHIYILVSGFCASSLYRI